ncbi:MAG: transposase [Gammaproteobacteria bacterium]|nr:transposase [Gammaproteobacteria bacterium]
MSYNDLRKGRFSEDNRIYFVTAVTYDRRPLFNNFNSARIVIQSMKHLHTGEHVNSLSWVLMPDHLHWLFQLSDEYTLAEVVKRLKAESACYINQHLNAKGSVWQRAYFDRCLRREEDVKQVSRYIVANPLRAGLVEDIGDYPHWDAVWL